MRVCFTFDVPLIYSVLCMFPFGERQQPKYSKRPSWERGNQSSYQMDESTEGKQKQELMKVFCNCCGLLWLEKKLEQRLLLLTESLSLAQCAWILKNKTEKKDDNRGFFIYSLSCLKVYVFSEVQSQRFHPAQSQLSQLRGFPAYPQKV